MNAIPGPLRSAIALSPLSAASILGSIAYASASAVTGISCMFGSDEMCDAFPGVSKMAVACIATAVISVSCVLSFRDMRQA